MNFRFKSLTDRHRALSAALVSLAACLLMAGCYLSTGQTKSTTVVSSANSAANTATTQASSNDDFCNELDDEQVDSGDAGAGQRVTRKRNVVKDFKLLFNRDISTLHGFAVMVDGDNTGAVTTSWFDKLSFSGDSDSMLQ